MKWRTQGFTLVEIMIVLMVIGFLAAISYPSYQRSRENAHRSVCQNNLRYISGIADQYLFENSGTQNLTVNDLQDEFKNSQIPECPAGGVYLLDVDRDPIATCTFGDGHEL